MDALDLRLLASMGITPWGQTPQDPDHLRPSRLAELHDVTPETVRERVDRMEQAGVIEAWEAYPNPAHLDADVTAFVYRSPTAEPGSQAMEDALLVDGVIEVLNFFGPLLAVAVAYRDQDELDRRLRLFGRQVGDGGAVRIFDPPMPEVDRELSDLDWRILDELRGQARRPLREVGEALGVTYRTVKRRFDRMTEEGSLFVVPRIQTARVSGILPFTLFFVLGEDAGPETVNTVVDRYGGRILHRFVPEDLSIGYVGLGLFADTLAEVEALRREALDVPGIEAAIVALPKGREKTDWVDERIAQRARAASEGLSGSPGEDRGS